MAFVTLVCSTYPAEGRSHGTAVINIDLKLPIKLLARAIVALVILTLNEVLSLSGVQPKNFKVELERSCLQIRRLTLSSWTTLASILEQYSKNVINEMLPASYVGIVFEYSSVKLDLYSNCKFG